MARDRQRAKQRRRRQAGAGGTQPGARRAARDRGLDEGHAGDAAPAENAENEELQARAGAEDEGTPAPDPLKHSSAWVDEAELAERGMEVPGPGESEELADAPDATEPFAPDATEPFDEEDFDDEDFERAPDEVEGDLVREERPYEQPAAAGAGATAAPRRRRGRALTFLGHCIDELKRVQWPDRRQTFQGTAVVLGFVVLAGSYLGLMDAIWKPIVEAII